jgi:hypothetical protein
MSTHSALDAYLAANPAEAVRKYAAYVCGPNRWANLATVTKADAAVEALCDALKAVCAELAAKDAEIARLQAGIYEGALGDMPPTCPHANSIYSYCLACVIEERDAEIERLKWQIERAIDYWVEFSPAVRGHLHAGQILDAEYAARQPEDGKV